MTEDEVLYTWALSELIKTTENYPASVIQLVSKATHDDSEVARIAQALREHFIGPKHNLALPLLDGRAEWQRVDVAAVEFGEVLLHPYWTRRASIEGWRPEPPTLSRFARARDLDLGTLDPTGTRGCPIIVGTGNGTWRFVDGCHRAYTMWQAGPRAVTVIRGVHPVAEAWPRGWGPLAR